MEDGPRLATIELDELAPKVEEGDEMVVGGAALEGLGLALPAEGGMKGGNGLGGGEGTSTLKWGERDSRDDVVDQRTRFEGERVALVGKRVDLGGEKRRRRRKVGRTTAMVPQASSSSGIWLRKKGGVWGEGEVEEEEAAAVAAVLTEAGKRRISEWQGEGIIGSISSSRLWRGEELY